MTCLQSVYDTAAVLGLSSYSVAAAVLPLAWQGKAGCLQSVGQTMPRDRVIIPVLKVGLRQHFCGTHDYALHCPRAAPAVGVVACTYHHWLEPFSQHRRYCQLPVSGRRMQRFLRFKLGPGRLPIDLGRFAGGQHVARAKLLNKVCTHCGKVAIADEMHMIFECPALQAVRQLLCFARTPTP